jgi:hypothetical protein
MGLKGVIKKGGQLTPISNVGEILLWKKDQKNEEKNKISEEINKIIPIFKPFITKKEWSP